MFADAWRLLNATKEYLMEFYFSFRSDFVFAVIHKIQ